MTRRRSWSLRPDPRRYLSPSVDICDAVYLVRARLYALAGKALAGRVTRERPPKFKLTMFSGIFRWIVSSNNLVCASKPTYCPRFVGLPRE